MAIKMDKASRAKQFMPFDALTGFRAALAERERAKCTRRELSEEERTELDYCLQCIRKGDVLTVKYYFNEEYVSITGRINKIDTVSKSIVVDDIRIAINDISDIVMEGIKDK